MISRRSFLQSTILISGALSAFKAKAQTVQQKVMTVTGPISANELGTTLIHEHILVDFIGAAKYD